MRSHVKNQCPSSRTRERERRSSYLNLNLTRKLLTCLRSMTKRSFFPLATDKGSTQNGGTLCSTMQPLTKSCEMACVTNSGCCKADLLRAKKHEGGYSAKGSLYPRLMVSSTNSGAFKVLFQKPTEALKRPLTLLLVLLKLKSSQPPPPHPPPKKRKKNLNPRLVKNGVSHSSAQQTTQNRRHSNGQTPRTIRNKKKKN